MTVVGGVQTHKDPECERLLRGSTSADDCSFGPVGFVQTLAKHFGFKLIVLLFFVQHLLKGFSYSFAGAATPYMFEKYSVAGPTSQIFSGVVSLPWAMKPAIGLVSDLFTIRGYRKLPYFVVTSVMAVVAMVMLATSSVETMSIQKVVICMFFCSFQVSTCDLLSEAKYAEKIQHLPAYGPDLLTYVWFGLQFAGLIAASLSGFVIDRFGPTAVYCVCCFPVAMVLGPVFLGYLEEDRMSDQEVAVVWERFRNQKEACLLCILMLACTVTLSVCGIVFEDPMLNGSLAILVGILVIICFSLVLSPQIAKFNAYSLIQSSLALSISGASFYFFTDSDDEYPAGPHFSPYFFNTVMGVSGALCSLLGIYLYNRFMSTWRYQHVLVVSNLIFATLSGIDVLMFTRANVRFGIPDHVFMMSSSVLENVVSMWMWMPQVVIFSYLCPKGMEATMYALLAGCANLGSTIASNVGAMLLQSLHVAPQGATDESDQFENLWLAALIATALPATTIILIFWLVPNTKQGDPIISDDVSRDATTGSIWRCWTEGENAK